MNTPTRPTEPSRFRIKDMKTFALLLAALLPCVAAAADVDKAKTLGNPSAPIMMELYSDFMCPHCKHLHEDILPAIVMDYVNTGKAYLIFREFPLLSRSTCIHGPRRTLRPPPHVWASISRYRTFC